MVRILGAHSKLCAIPFESSFLMRWWEPCENSRKFLARCDYYARHMGKERWIEKSPAHILLIKELQRHCPEAKLLLMIRDGRDVACSYQDRLGNLEVGIERWVRFNRGADGFWQHPNVHVVRYEKLVTELEPTLRGIMAFVGEEYEEGMLRYHEKPLYYFSAQIQKPENSFMENLTMFRNWQMNQPLFDGRGKWLRMSEAEKQLFKDRAGEMLIRHGYVADSNW